MNVGELKKMMETVPDDFDLMFILKVPDGQKHYRIQGVQTYDNYMHTNKGVVGLIARELGGFSML